MKINTENSSRMILQDNKYSRFFTAICLVIGGLLIASLLAHRSFVAVIVVVAFMAAGGFILFITRRVTITLDKAAGNIRILLRGLTKKEEQELPMAQIKKMVLRK